MGIWENSSFRVVIFFIKIRKIHTFLHCVTDPFMGPGYIGKKKKKSLDLIVTVIIYYAK